MLVKTQHKLIAAYGGVEPPRSKFMAVPLECFTYRSDRLSCPYLIKLGFLYL